jgi:hypothetical protein
LAEFFISKASYENGLLSKVLLYNSDLTDNNEYGRVDLLRALRNGHQLTIVTKNGSGEWIRAGEVNIIRLYAGEFLRIDGTYTSSDYLGNIPLALPVRKTFVSYYHKSDQGYKKLFEKLFGDLIINKSVADGDINEGNSTQYIKLLIQKGYLTDTSIIIVLVSEFTKCRKHIDWEMSGALNYKVGDAYAGLIGLHLPHHSEYGVRTYIPSLQPARLSDNAGTGYAKIYDWSYDRCIMQQWLEDAFDARKSRGYMRDNNREQMGKNTGGD